MHITARPISNFHCIFYLPFSHKLPLINSVVGYPIPMLSCLNHKLLDGKLFQHMYAEGREASTEALIRMFKGDCGLLENVTRIRDMVISLAY